MDVLNNRSIDKTIILGSGESILKLTQEEIYHINHCKTVIAVNKYMAFYKLVGIIPTHVYFHDITGYNIYTYIVDLCLKDKLENITLLTCEYFDTLSYQRRSELIFKFIKDLLKFRFYTFSVIIFKLGNTTKRYYTRTFRKFKYKKLPYNFNVIPIKVTSEHDKPVWANSLRQTIFHYKGSVSSVLNISSIISPNQDIYMVGNDFNGSKYFYENELNKLGIPWKDASYKNVKEAGVHYSFQNTNGKTILDKFPEIVMNLKERGCNIYCNNENSLLTTEAGVAYKPLLESENLKNPILI